MLDLPDEIIGEILVRLPAISLVRFILVCKHWRSLIFNPNFVRKHLNHVLSHQSNNNHHKLIVDSHPSLYSIDCESLISSKRDFRLQSQPPSDISILGSCNGLLLIGCYDRHRPYYDNLVLWNPLLGGRDYNELPGCRSISGSIRVIGFGYDSCTDDYKVMRLMTKSAYQRGPIGTIEHRVDIYSMKTNSWKIIQGLPFGNVYIGIGVERGTLVDGCLYWLVTDLDVERSNNSVLAFDLRGNEFKLVKIPADLELEPPYWRSMIEVRGNIGLYVADQYSCEVVICVLNEDKNKTGLCWSLFMRIPNDFRMFIQPAFFTKNDQVLLILAEDILLRQDRKLVVYDSKNKIFRNLPAFGTIWYNEMMYVETLVSPNAGRR